MKYRTRPWFPVLLGLLVLGAFAAIPQAAFAQPQLDGTSHLDGCMQTAFGTPVTNSNKLNCTANDIKISSATSVSPTSCVQGTHFDLTATFETVVTANARYDAAFFFRVDGGPNARGDGSLATGDCSISQLTDIPGGQGLQLDGDSCYDLNAGTYFLTFTIPQVYCNDLDADGFLNLPNCTSWHSNQGTLCTEGSPFTDAKPDTKSKCVCDDTFNVPVTVEKPAGAVTKTAKSATVTYEVTVKNESANRTVIVGNLNDNVYGDITTYGHNGITSTNCANGTSLAPGISTTACQFTVDATSSSGPQKDTVTARLSGSPSQGPNDYIDVSGDATVVVTLNP